MIFSIFFIANLWHTCSVLLCLHFSFNKYVYRIDIRRVCVFYECECLLNSGFITTAPFFFRNIGHQKCYLLQWGKKTIKRKLFFYMYFFFKQSVQNRLWASPLRFGKHAYIGLSGRLFTICDNVICICGIRNPRNIRGGHAITKTGKSEVAEVAKAAGQRATNMKIAGSSPASPEFVFFPWSYIFVAILNKTLKEKTMSPLSRRGTKRTFQLIPKPISVPLPSGVRARRLAS